MKVLRRRRRLADLDVVLGGEIQETLRAGARVLRPLPLVTVRQQKDQTRQEAPFVLTGRQELVDDHLRAVGEVPELRLPKDERLRIVAAVAVLEAQRRRLRQGRVVDRETRLALLDVSQRVVLPAGLGVDQDGVPLVERAAPAVLPAQADRDALDQK